MSGRATFDQDDVPMLFSKMSDPFPPKPVGLKRFWTVAREHVTSEKELAAWKPQALCIVNITVGARKAQPHAWVPTYIQTHKVQVYTAQPDRKAKIPPNTPLRVQWSLWTSTTKIRANWRSRYILAGWNFILEVGTHVPLIQFHELNTVLNISLSHRLA